GEKYFDLDVTQIGGGGLLVSQFTLAAGAREGGRASLLGAEGAGGAGGMFEQFVGVVRGEGVRVEAGRVGAEMEGALGDEGGGLAGLLVNGGGGRGEAGVGG